MKLAVTVLLSSFLFFTCSSYPLSRPSNWLKQCRASADPSISALGVLPGRGWDNLRNMDMGRVMNLSYFQCQTTEDGNYLIPDEVFVIPQKETGVETSSEIISSWLEQKSSTANTINADFTFFKPLNGKFSTENKRIKSHQVKESSTTVRVQVRNLIYTVKAYPDFILDVRFTQQAKDIADAIENNQTKLADYLSEKMVLDYGTHVITSVDAGAILMKEDYLTSTYVSDNESKNSTIKSEAGLNFFDTVKFEISSESGNKSSSQQKYQSNIQYSLIQSHGGGTPFYPGITLQKWQESIRNNLVAIDRSGFSLQYVINSNTFPDLPQPAVIKVAQAVGKAIERYYKINTRPGCVDIKSKNFNFQANVDDKSCQGPATNLSFGGVYQQCAPISADAGPLCDALTQQNPDTGDYSCRPPFVPILLRSEVRQQPYSSYECHEHTYKCGYFSSCTDKLCGENSHVRTARIDTYWCAVNGKAPDHSGYLFGGLYGPSRVNPITKTKSCPPNFIPLKFLSDGQVICVSKDFETKYMVPFGGFFSCQANNTLAKSRRRCPPQFSQLLAAVSDGCEILYCVQSGWFTDGQLQPIRLPPFTKSPLVTMEATNTLVVVGSGGEKSWVRVGETKTWKLVRTGKISEIIRQLNPEQNEMTSGQITGIVLGVLGVLVIVALLMAAVRYKKKKLSGPKTALCDYVRINGRNESETLTEEA